MFDTLKKDISIGDFIKLYLTNSNEKPEGKVLEIGENFVLLENNDGTKSRFFDKLIGGWELIRSNQPKDNTSVIEPQIKPAQAHVPKPEGFVHRVVVPIETFFGNQTEKELPRSMPSTAADANRSPFSQIVLPRSVPQIPSTGAAANRSPFSQIDREITTLINEGGYKSAMQKINDNLEKPNIDDKNKSRLLLMKAQLYSTLQDPENSENTYIELVNFNEKSNELKWNKSALSHYYTELARLQAQKREKLPLALESVRKAIGYNDRNLYAVNLLQRLESITSSARPSEESVYTGEENQEDGDLLVEAGDNINEISLMLKIDFEEHKYTHPLIVRNGGVPTPFIADSLIEQARTILDIGERCLINLEAAKAYQELPPGSYELPKYLNAAAFYARFKGDVLYNKFKKEILENNIVLDELIRIKDSACSYYLESTKLLSTIRPVSVKGIIANYIKLNVVLYHKKNGKAITEMDFEGQFNNIVKYCLTSKDKELEKIVWITFVDLGASSSHAWNVLIRFNKESEFLYREFRNYQNCIRIYDLINSIWGWNPIDTSLRSNQFLQTAFRERRKLENEFEKAIVNIQKIAFEGDMIEQIIQSWSIVSKYENLLTATDKETERSIDKALEIAKPYQVRNPVERTNILIGIQNIIEKQIDFINRNTTVYGRTYFFPLLSKWKKDIGNLLSERIIASRPKLKIIIDPQYYFVQNNEISIPLIIENEGETTSESCVIYGTVKSIEGNIPEYTFKKELKVEISAGSKTETSINAPLELITHSQIIDLDINVEAKYLNKTIEAKNFKYTLEEEAASNLTIEDIPWDERHPPAAQLFKGREAVIDMLCKHYCSLEREKPYILYGLTRTGKSSILKYLKEKINGKSISIQGQLKTIVTIEWGMDTAANMSNASEFWESIVLEQSYKSLRSDIKININSSYNFENKKDARAKDFQILIECLNKAGYYPLFLVDEFSHIRSLIDKKTIQPAFLAVLRQFSFNNQAGFLFAGTYDIKELIERKEYGITGQLVHANNYQVDRIDDQAAEELINVIKEKLTFTKEAISHIMKLSGNIPYFIQIICKYCGNYAVENKRHSIGYPELEKVIRILTGLDDNDKESKVQIIPDFRFQNNQYDPGDPPNVTALISSIAWFNRDSLTDPHGVRMSELEKLWGDHKVTGYRPKLADAVIILLDKRIITSKDDEGDTVYRISVDLFRRWWFCHHPDIKLALLSISEEL